MVEQLTLNQLVEGSSPSRCTKSFGPEAMLSGRCIDEEGRKRAPKPAAMKKIVVSTILALCVSAASFAPASAFLDKTRFLAHLGVAYFAFHHWVYAPYRQGDFAQGAPHRLSHIVKGGIALLFAVHEVHVSEEIAQKSHDPLLRKLDAGLATLTGSFSSIGDRMKSGQFDPTDVGTLLTQTTSEQSTAAANGTRIKDVAAAIPGL